MAVRSITVLDDIRQRRATRGYTTEPVDEVAVRSPLDVAVYALSANNLRSWSCMVIQGGKLLRTDSRGLGSLRAMTGSVVCDSVAPASQQGRVLGPMWKIELFTG